MALSDYEVGRDHTDRELVLADQSGDPAAFREIVRSYYGELLGDAIRRLGERRGAEDVVQETLLAAYRGLGDFGGEYRLGAWLHKVLANGCTSEQRRRRRELDAQRRWFSEPELPVSTPEERGLLNDAARHVADAIAALPPIYREALVLRDVMDLDYCDVASRAGISEQNARTRVARARAVLRQSVGGTLASLGAFVSRPFRAALRWSLRAQSLTQSAASVSPDVMVGPVRAGAAVTTVAAALAAVAAGPLAVGSTQPGPVIVRTPAVAAPASIPASRVPPAALLAIAGAAPLASTTSSSTAVPPVTVKVALPQLKGSTTTTSSTTSTTVPPPTPLGTAHFWDYNIVAQNGSSPPTYTGTAELPWQGVTYSASLVLRTSLPTEPNPSCSGSLQGTLHWTDPAGRLVTFAFTAVVASEAPQSSGDTYRFVGTANASGDPNSLNGTGWISGALTLAPDHSYGAIEADVGSGNGPTACANVAPAPTTTTTTTAH